ncbi:MAG: tyrosine--tRNA ligase [Anaerococcus prevotii]|uniref:tyrosine--tRNA ligase n=1 Tax=Anaerococcus prevotii TaxID=33034 RepID=UPI0028FDE8CD|nr:tyrosine--tRNA ligase [Anaerococcus prevotii]MDU2559054.1 tyrosine--tRNA ligase [Anaerococcus prevotii]
MKFTYEKEYDNVFDELVDRGYYEQATNEEELKKLLKEESVKFYCGFDATADSLTVGHLIQIMVMMRMQNYGHRPVALLGGGTTLIGDPSGRSDMRKVMTEEMIDHNAECFYNQFQRFLDFSEGGATILNNKDWLLDLNFVEFLRDVGSEFLVNEMIKKDAYKNRMAAGGLTFFEFSYMLLQSYDFLKMYREDGVRLEMGGSDQWSNIIGGVDLIKKHEDGQAYGMTFSLLTTSDGVKMGKSQKGAVWLDEKKTSPYEMYQYMRNVDDRDVEKFLLQLTFLPTEECRKLGSAKDAAEINKAKEILAYEVVKLVHGKEKADEAIAAAKALFTGKGDESAMPTTQIAKSDLPKGLLILMTETGLTKSNGEARRIIKQGGVSINDEKVADPSIEVTEDLFEDGRIIIKKGKKNFHKVELI